jgi:hypothetical protein
MLVTYIRADPTRDLGGHPFHSASSSALLFYIIFMLSAVDFLTLPRRCAVHRACRALFGAAKGRNTLRRRTDQRKETRTSLIFSIHTQTLSFRVCVCVCAGVRVSDELADRSRYKSADLEG